MLDPLVAEEVKGAGARAGGGRAGCSNKDFYNTGLKLEMLKKQAEK